jgi:ATP-dependent RNA helicase DDX5/DBP2
MDLPAGWQEVKSHDGGVYYWNTMTNDVQWEKPTGGSSQEAYGAADIFNASDLSASDGDWLKKHEVALSKGCPPPLTTFEAANLPPSLMMEIQRAGFPSPSPIREPLSQTRPTVGALLHPTPHP